ncbi:MAG: GHKL domain-containing protein [Bacteroidetes bacterium]|nr:GHKL domain-containing protein [Bacteroidota bacterium]
MTKGFIACIFSVLLGTQSLWAQQPEVTISKPDEVIQIKNNCSFFELKEDTLNFQQVKKLPFAPVKHDVPNFGISTSTFWLKVEVKNETKLSDFVLQVSQPILDYVSFYYERGDSVINLTLGEYKVFSDRWYYDPSYMLPFEMQNGSSSTIYLKVKAKENVQVPMSIGSRQAMLELAKKKDVYSGIYLGIMFVMLLYNGFIWISTRDKSYFYYVLYLFFVILTQSSIQGYSFQYFWPNIPWLARYNSFLFPSLVGITGMQFMRVFLHTDEHSKYFKYIFYVVTSFYALGTALSFMGSYSASFYLIETCAVVASAAMMTVAIRRARTGDRPAFFFAIAWAVFLVGVSMYVMKDFGILPYNNFTYYMMPVGSAIEVMLLSFALADRINILKKEKEASQEEALRVSKENERIIREQNAYLEQKVQERTIELQETNEELVVTLNHLKETQAQLVDAEKMASLGQLTAGIAHEINNPINFVSANVQPLRLDIQDILSIIDQYGEAYKADDPKEKVKSVEDFMKEIDFDYIRNEVTELLTGIEDGAIRTSEIVKGLKTFSRLDESDLKPADLNEGLNSTLILLRNSIPDNVLVETELGDLPPVECFPGKINQVFMNILSNALQAMKTVDQEEKHTLKVTSEFDDKNVYFHIKDSGPGMTDDVKARIFEPFFTTKDVGEGTGLGLSIVFKIIETHGGNIAVNTELGKGTEFIITLPIEAKLNTN